MLGTLKMRLSKIKRLVTCSSTRGGAELFCRRLAIKFLLRASFGVGSCPLNTHDTSTLPGPSLSPPSPRGSGADLSHEGVEMYAGAHYTRREREGEAPCEEEEEEVASVVNGSRWATC